MWLHRRLHAVISFAARTYYQVAVAGGPVPRSGPVLLVANHPNSLLDPALIAAAANRPVQFLARAPLFEERGLGWLVRGTGAIPVYRRTDDPELVGRNEETFAAVYDALARGSAIGIFPEGLSHAGPSLAPLKTGAARIALGAANRMDATFPVLPVGITFRGGRERFRSTAITIIGRPVRWDDLMTAGHPTQESVRELTRRLHVGLSRVTVNLESWEDFPVVEGAEAIHQAEFSTDSDGHPSSESIRWLVRMRRTAHAVQRARTNRPDEWEPLARDIVRHMRVLRVLGLEPRNLHNVPGISVALRWTVKNLSFFCLALPLAFLGKLVFFLPNQLVTRAEPRFDLSADRRASYQVLAGAVASAGWILLIAAVLRESLGWRPALAALGILPLLGLLTLRIRGRWRTAVTDLKRILLRGRADLRTRLLLRQIELAARIRNLQRSD